MPRTARLFVPVDVNIGRDAAEAGLTPTAGWLYLLILADCKARHTDGLISRSTLRQLGINGYQHPLKLLIYSGWISDLGGDKFKVTAWEKWHESEKDIAARQEADRQRKRLANRIPRRAFRLPD